MTAGADDGARVLHGPEEDGDGTGLTVVVHPLGASWLSCRVPMGPGQAPREVLAGPGTATDARRRATYAGATIGRYANRIAGARLAATGHALAPHPPGSPHQLHGGPDGWDRRRWAVEHAAHDRVTFALHSPAGDQGFPGAVDARVHYAMRPGRALRITFEARADAPTPVAMTNHAYFNLDATAPDGRPTDARGHRLWLNATHMLPVDAALVPRDGGLAAVAGGAFDFATAPRPADARPHADDPQIVAGGGGYDHGWLLAPACADGAADALRLSSADGRLTMALRTTMPALQFYDGRAMDCAGLALEPGWLADSPNRTGWPQPSCWLAAGEVRRGWVEYRF